MLRAEPQSVRVPRGVRTESDFVGDFTASHLHVTAHPDGADIALDGKSIGTGHFDGEIAIGDARPDGLSRRLQAGRQARHNRRAQATASEDVTLEHLVTAEELAAAREEEDAEAIRGGYGQVALFGAYPASSTHLSCGEVAAPGAGINDTCTTGFVLGGGLALRGGYSFGIVGLELVGLFIVDPGRTSVTYTSRRRNRRPPAPPVNRLGRARRGRTRSRTIGRHGGRRVRG